MCHCLPRQRTETQTQLGNVSPRDHPAYINLLEELENTEKLFAAHDLVQPINGSTMEAFIDSYLQELLGFKLQNLEDPNLANRICLAFFKKKNLVLEWKQKSKLPLFEGLLLAYISHKMMKLFNSIHEPSVAEDYEKMRNKMDDLCSDLLGNCFKKSEEGTRNALELNYHSFIHSGDCDGYKTHEIKLMEIAYIGKANKFLAHPACQKAIDRRWQPSYRIGQTSLWLYVYYFSFFPFLIEKLEPYAKEPNEPRWTRIKNFYKSTSSKYVVHMLFRIIYVLFYSFALIRLSGKNMKRVTFWDDFWEQIVILIWQSIYLLEMIIVMFKRRLTYWARRNTINFYQNLLIALNLMLLSLALVIHPIRFIFLPLADLCFYVSYVTAVLRSMKVLNVDSFFGLIVYMINKMVQLMIKFFLIFIFFWIAFAVCYISLSGHFHDNSYSTLPWQMFYHGAFEIFGEAIDEDKKGYITSCKDFNINSNKDTSFYSHCLFRTWMIPLLLFSYILIAGILLVNILTALMTKQYDDISRDYHVYWKVALYARLAEYEDKIFIPAPFSVIYYIYLFVVWVPTALLKCLHEACKKEREGRLSDSVEMINLLSPTPAPPVPRTPTLVRAIPMKSMTQQDIDEREISRPEQLLLEQGESSKEVVRRAKRLAGKRPHSTMDIPSFRAQTSVHSTISSRPETSMPSSPMEAIENTLEAARHVIQTISNPEMENKLAILKFIQEMKTEMTDEQNEKKMQRMAKQKIMDQILQKFDLNLTERARGMTK